jgi:hypothetical protein
MSDNKWRLLKEAMGHSKGLSLKNCMKLLGNDWLPFEEAREYVKSLGLKNSNEWQAFSKSGNRPSNIPSSPKQVYKDSGWIGMRNWLGTENVRRGRSSKWRPFDEARECAKGLGLKSYREWDAFSKSGNRPKDIPSHPNKVYKDSGWVNWGDWLGTGNVYRGDRPGTGNVYRGDRRSFEEARKYIRSLNFKSSNEWRVFSKSGNRPKDIPSHPDKAYRDSGWINWSDWIGNVARYNWRSFEEAREYIKGLGLKGKKEWRAFSKSGNRPKDIPASPNQVYKDSGWVNWGDWLGTGNVRKGDWRSFDEAREYAKSLGFRSIRKWRAFSKSGNRPKDIPSNPDKSYRDSGWINWSDWLGNVAQYNWYPLEEATEYAESLESLCQKWQ